MKLVKWEEENIYEQDVPQSGYTQQEPANAFIKAAVSVLASELTTKAEEIIPGAVFDDSTLEAISFILHRATATTYVIKFRAGDTIFHFRLFENFYGLMTVAKLIGPKELEDPVLPIL